MPSFWDRINPFSSKSYTMPIANKNFRSGVSDFFTGTPEKRENVSTLRPEQEPLYEQAVKAGLEPGAGGAFGTSADYYRNLLSDDSADFNAFAAPQLRQYNQDIVPAISEQFAQGGGGQGSFSSSGFRNAQTQGAIDLAERLGSMRANLRQAGAQGLSNIGQIGLQPYSQNMVTQPGSEGFLTQAAKILPHAAAAYFTGGASIPGSAAMFANQNSWGGNKVGQNTVPDWRNTPASPQSRSNFQFPNFMQR